MQMFRLSLYKDLSNSEGHVFRCLEREFDISAENVSAALKLAEDRLANSDVEVDAIEVVPVVDRPVNSDELWRAVVCKCGTAAA